VLLLAAVWERLVTARPPERGEASRRIARLFLLTIASAAACCCTPMLPGMVRTALHYGSTDPMVAGGYIAEMRPFFIGTMGMVSATIVGLALAVVLCARCARSASANGCVSRPPWRCYRSGDALPRCSRSPSAPVIAVALGRLLSDRVLASPAVAFGDGLVLIVAIVRIGGEFPGSNVTLALWTNRHGVDAPGYPHDAAQYVSTRVNPRKWPADQRV
jgi:hypothetical protein